MLETSPLFDVSKETNESSHKIFTTAFPDGFAWEVLDVFSGPPAVSFSWRHWAHWTGVYMNREPTGELIELFGTCVAKVNDDLKLVDLQVFFDASSMLTKLKGLPGGLCRCPYS